jgi:hypothetical protein
MRTKVAKKQKRTAVELVSKSEVGQLDGSLLSDLRTLINQVRGRVAHQVNTELVLLKWHMGKRISAEILKLGKPEYGSQLLDKVASELTAEYGRGFDRSALSRIVRLVEVFPDEEIFATVSQKLG